MSVDLDARLRELAATLPEPDDLVEGRLRAALARPPAPRRRMGRVLAIAATLTVAVTAAGAYAATQTRIFDGGRLVSVGLHVGPRDPSASHAVARRLTCTDARSVLACRPLAPGERAPSAYRLASRATHGTLWIFVVGGSRLAPVAGMPPLIACPAPSATAVQRCEPVLARTVLPEGTPIYDDVVHGGR
jgi:hypothetical protein